MTAGSSDDVIVVGGGFAGFCAAVRAAELGLRTTLLEKSTLDPSSSNSRTSTGGLHAAALSLNTRPETIVEKLTRDTAGTARPDVVRAFAEDALNAFDWLVEQGISTADVSHRSREDFRMVPRAQHRDGLQWDGTGPDLALRRLKQRLVDLGGSYRNGHRATELVAQGGRVTGVIVEGPHAAGQAMPTRAVVLADGGFQANRDMVNRYIAPDVFDRIKLRGVDTGTGDGIRMAEAVGAKLVQMDSFYGHCVSLDALRNDRLWPYPIFDGIIATSVLVWRHSAERFVDEGIGGIAVANAIAKAADPQAAVIIFDDDAWNGPGVGVDLVGPTPPNPSLVRNGGTFHTADSIGALGARAGLDAERLSATIERYNRALRGDRGDLDVPRTGEPPPIETPPFHAIPVVPGITYTMGGVLIDGDARVLDRREEPIPGLWAAGATAGGLEGGPRAGYAGGLSQTVVFGKRAAESIRASLRS